tara:strand:- start:239 stop:544 length:306 start_codon:yes stop_codon:yes gene_type:complete
MAASIKEIIEFEKDSSPEEESSMVGREFVDDMVNHPPHYNQKGIECIDAIEAATDKGFEYYLQGNIVKYLWRYRYKNGVEDLNKAQWYLSKLIEIKNGNTD